MFNLRTHLVVLFATLICMTAATSFAANEGRIIGTVSDASGNPVAEAKVTLIREGSQSKQEKVTSTTGSFSLLVLDATAQYRIHIEKEHFAPIDEPIKPVSGDTVRVSYTLKES